MKMARAATPPRPIFRSFQGRNIVDTPLGHSLPSHHPSVWSAADVSIVLSSIVLQEHFSAIFMSLGGCVSACTCRCAERRIGTYRAARRLTGTDRDQQIRLGGRRCADGGEATAVAASGVEVHSMT